MRRAGSVYAKRQSTDCISDNPDAAIEAGTILFASIMIVERWQQRTSDGAIIVGQGMLTWRMMERLTGRSVRAHLIVFGLAIVIPVLVFAGLLFGEIQGDRAPAHRIPGAWRRAERRQRRRSRARRLHLHPAGARPVRRPAAGRHRGVSRTGRSNSRATWTRSSCSATRTAAVLARTDADHGARERPAAPRSRPRAGHVRTARRSVSNLVTDATTASLVVAVEIAGLLGRVLRDPVRPGEAGAPGRHHPRRDDPATTGRWSCRTARAGSSHARAWRRTSSARRLPAPSSRAALRRTARPCGACATSRDARSSPSTRRSTRRLDDRRDGSHAGRCNPPCAAPSPSSPCPAARCWPCRCRSRSISAAASPRRSGRSPAPPAR